MNSHRAKKKKEKQKKLLVPCWVLSTSTPSSHDDSMGDLVCSLFYIHISSISTDHDDPKRTNASSRGKTVDTSRGYQNPTNQSTWCRSKQTKDTHLKDVEFAANTAFAVLRGGVGSTVDNYNLSGDTPRADCVFKVTDCDENLIRYFFLKFLGAFRSLGFF